MGGFGGGGAMGYGGGGFGMQNPMMSSMGIGMMAGMEMAEMAQMGQAGQMGGMGQMGQMGGMGQMQQMQQMMMQMMQMMQMMMQGQGQGGMQNGMPMGQMGGMGQQSPGMNFGGQHYGFQGVPSNFGNQGGGGNYGGGGYGGGNNYGGGGYGGNSGGIQTPDGGGGRAVQIAASHLGQDAQNVQMSNYSAAGGRTNDCADFVSGCLADAGMFHKTSGDASVSQFKEDLQRQGYHQVSKEQSQPGDVAIIQGGGVSHTELVASQGAGKAIGANGTSQERVSTGSLNWADGRTAYFHKG
jgi:hypothetical protein